MGEIYLQTGTHARTRTREHAHTSAPLIGLQWTLIDTVEVLGVELWQFELLRVLQDDRANVQSA